MNVGLILHVSVPRTGDNEEDANSFSIFMQMPVCSTMLLGQSLLFKYIRGFLTGKVPRCNHVVEAPDCVPFVRPSSS